MRKEAEAAQLQAQLATEEREEEEGKEQGKGGATVGAALAAAVEEPVSLLAAGRGENRGTVTLSVGDKIQYMDRVRLTKDEGGFV